MTWKFVLLEESVSVTHKLSGPALFGTAGVHWDFATPNVCHSAAARDLAWRKEEFAPLRPQFHGGI